MKLKLIAQSDQIKILQKNISDKLSLSEISNHPLSLLESYKNTDLNFAVSTDDFVLCRFESEEYWVFGEKNNGLYALKNIEIFFLNHEHSKELFCSSSFSNFVSIYTYILSRIFLIKSEVCQVSEIDFQAHADAIKAYILNIEGDIRFEETHWEEIYYEISEGFFPFKPSLKFYIENNVLPLPNEEPI